MMMRSAVGFAPSSGCGETAAKAAENGRLALGQAADDDAPAIAIARKCCKTS